LNLAFKGKEKGDATSIINNVHKSITTKVPKGERQGKISKSHNLMYIIVAYALHKVFRFLPNTLPSFYSQGQIWFLVFEK
jgi:hypothetical protein